MDEYSTTLGDLQVVISTKEDGAAVVYHIDPATGNLEEPLDDPKFAWRRRKAKTLVQADLYAKLGDRKHEEKAKTCSTWLQYLTNGQTRELHHFNGCKNRLCPICSVRKARILAHRLAKTLEKVAADHPHTQQIFLTLTVQNCTGDKLRETLDLLTLAWHRLLDRKSVLRAVKGSFRAIEITYNPQTKTFHPHIHAILIVEDAYFKAHSPLYITHTRWLDMWQRSLRVPYKPSVDVRSTYTKGGKGKPSKGAQKAAAAALEAAKYATKDSDYMNDALPADEAAEVLGTYTRALVRKRMTGMSGWIKDAAAQLKLDMDEVTDLVHDEDGDGELTKETAPWLEDYGWHFGLAEHTLQARYDNPDFKG